MFFKACYSNLTSIAHLLIQENAKLDLQIDVGETALNIGIKNKKVLNIKCLIIIRKSVLQWEFKNCECAYTSECKFGSSRKIGCNSID